MDPADLGFLPLIMLAACTFIASVVRIVNGARTWDVILKTSRSERVLVNLCFAYLMGMFAVSVRDSARVLLSSLAIIFVVLAIREAFKGLRR